MDRSEAAETVVAILIDNDCDVDDIKDTFKGDTDIKRALTAYLDNDKDYVKFAEEMIELTNLNQRQYPLTIKSFNNFKPL